MSLSAILKVSEILVNFWLKAVHTSKKGVKRKCYRENEALLLLAKCNSKDRHKKTDMFPSGTIEKI